MTYPYRTTMALNTYQYRETTMIDPKKIEQIARQVHESMPKGLRDLGEDVEKKIRQALQSQLTRLDLVSREEFDVQTQVLLRTREKLALLEQRGQPMTLAQLAQALPPGEHDLDALTLWLSVAREAGVAWDGAQEHITTTDATSAAHATAQHWRFTLPQVALDAAAVRAVGGDL